MILQLLNETNNNDNVIITTPRTVRNPQTPEQKSANFPQEMRELVSSLPGAGYSPGVRFLVLVVQRLDTLKTDKYFQTVTFM